MWTLKDHTLKGNSNRIYFMFVTMVDSAIAMLEIGEIPTVISVNKKDTTDKVFNTMSAQISRFVYKA